MIIARAPLRISFAGGGTDIPAYSDRFGGLVISTTIDRHVYIVLTDAPQDSLQITSSDASSMLSKRDHLFDSALFWGNDYRLPIETLNYFGINGGCRIFIASEVPPGTGLGSSSATAVALITALSAYRQECRSKQEIADLACHIEIDRLKMPIGRQDQFASAYGGLNLINFCKDETRVLPCSISENIQNQLQERIMLFFTGVRRRSTDILSVQTDAIEQSGPEVLDAMHEIKAIALSMLQALTKGDLDEVGSLLDYSWKCKRQITKGVSTPQIDTWYEAAKQAGAQGGKITGAGGGGFLLLYAEPERRRDVIRRMNELGLVWVDTQFDTEGASTVVAAPDRNVEKVASRAQHVSQV